MECKKCVHRNKSGLCKVTKVYVPKKCRKDGTNPADSCQTFKRKKGITETPVKKSKPDPHMMIVMEAEGRLDEYLNGFKQ